MNIDFERIKKEYPKSYKKFYDFMPESFENISGKITIIKEFDILCFCDFVEFFDSEGIRIFILPYFASIGNDELESYQVLIIDKVKSYKYGIHKTRTEAQAEAVYKAFEITEGLCTITK